MSNFPTASSQRTASAQPIPTGVGDLPDAALSGVRRRRIFAALVDMLFIVLFCAGIILGLAALSAITLATGPLPVALAALGALWFLLPSLFQIVAFFYNGITISGIHCATPGMRLMDLEVRLTDGRRVPFLNAAVHAVLFYVSWMFPLIFVVSLISSEKRCLHDVLAGMIVIRRIR